MSSYSDPSPSAAPESTSPQSTPPTAGDDAPPDPIVLAIWESVERLRNVVENDHDHRLRKIESDVRWLTLLLAAQIVALISAAIAGLFGGG